jgi:hypothetical protein
MSVSTEAPIATNSALVHPSEASRAPVKAAVICLVIAWIAALAPIPFLSSLLMWAFNLIAFILGIICIARQRVFPGAAVIAGTLIGTPILYFLSYPLMMLFGAGAVMHAVETDPMTHPKNSPAKAAQVIEQTSVVAPAQSAQAASSAVDLSGDWTGEYTYKTYPAVPFSVKLSAGSLGGILGTASEKIKVKNDFQTIESSFDGEMNASSVSFVKSFMFNKVRHTVAYKGSLIDSKTIEGSWVEKSNGAKGTFKMYRAN